jgi:hypothetical protein
MSPSQTEGNTQMTKALAVIAVATMIAVTAHTASAQALLSPGQIPVVQYQQPYVPQQPQYQQPYVPQQPQYRAPASLMQPPPPPVLF